MGILPQKRFYRKTSFRVKRPIRSFRDLEVYQRTARSSVRIMKEVLPLLEGKGRPCPVKDKLVDCALEIPRMIGKAHSKRFDEREVSLGLLEDVMSLCNDAVVYLEQMRDIYADDVDAALFNDIVKEYFFSRRKIFNLRKAWIKMDAEYAKRGGSNVTRQ